jgi:hypothetical protein
MLVFLQPAEYDQWLNGLFDDLIVFQKRCFIATFRAFELQHRFGPLVRPIARAPEHPIAAMSYARNRITPPRTL